MWSPLQPLGKTGQWAGSRGWPGPEGSSCRRAGGLAPRALEPGLSLGLRLPPPPTSARRSPSG